MAGERVLRTDADTIVGVNVNPESTPFTPEVRTAIKKALVARIVADRLALEADKASDRYFNDLRDAVDVAAVHCWDNPSEIFPLWEEAPDDLLEDVLSPQAADEFGVIVQLLDSDLSGEIIAYGLSFAPSEQEILAALRALIASVRKPLDI